MKVRVIQPAELDNTLRQRWREIQNANAGFASPFFCPEFTEAVASVRNDVRVGVMEAGDRVVGFFPHQRRPFGFGRPVGLGLSDHHGVIVEPDAEWCADELLAQCQLVRWQFDHLIATQQQFAPYQSRTDISPIIETGQGFDAYLHKRKAMGGSDLTNTQRKMRKLARELEPHQFTEQDADPIHLAQLLRLKSAQCRQSGAYDFTQLRWIRDLLVRLQEAQSHHFRATLSTLRVGQRVVALHFGICSGTVWHWWLPNYEADLGAYSPGLILLFETIRSAAATGAHHLDLGKDLTRYKIEFMTGQIKLAEGEVYRRARCANILRAASGAPSLGSSLGPLASLSRIHARLAGRAHRVMRYR